MAEQRRGLGRGLDALLGGSGAAMTTATPADIQRLPLTAIRPNPHQPRRAFDAKALEDLAASIRERGVLQPILVRPLPGKDEAYELIAGERRWRAAKQAGLAVIPALVRELSDEDSLAIALVENLQREDLNPMEEALGYRELMERFQVSQEEVGQRVGKSRSAVANTLRLLHLPQAAQDDLFASRLSAGHARALLAIGEAEAQEELRQRILDQELSVREAEYQAAVWKKDGRLPEAGAAPTSRPSRKGSRETSEEQRQLTEELAAAFNVRVTVKGAPERGRISLHYATKEQYEALVARLRWI